jgi:DNA-binding CsgD family transcriptional regulator
MGQLRSEQTAAVMRARARPLPFSDDHWQAIIQMIGFSQKQAAITELMLGDLSDSEIALALGISKSTVQTYQARIAHRTGTRGRMQLAMHILAVALQVAR